MVSLKVNGLSVEANATPDTPLLWVLRDHLGLTGTKFGFGIGQCGACTVHLDVRELPWLERKRPTDRACGPSRFARRQRSARGQPDQGDPRGHQRSGSFRDNRHAVVWRGLH